MRIILYTGKGGVGKTTVAAATALRCAELGHKTLVVSTDPAHSLADAFDRSLGPDPTEVRPNLWGQEINVLEEIETYWGEVARYLTALFSSRGIDEVVAEEMAIFPGTEELCGLLQIRRHAESRRFDCLIVDCAPTAETLRLLSFPDVAHWYMEKLFPWERRIMKTIRPAIQPLVEIPLPRDQVFAGIERLFRQVEEVKRLLIDPERSTVRLVLNPEKMVIKESQRALTYLCLYGYSADLVITNRVFSEELGEVSLAGWRKIQARHREAIGRAFDPLPIREVPLFDREVVGLQMLGRMAETLFAGLDPAKVFFSGKVQTLRREGSGYTLTLRMPFARPKDLSLMKVGNELVISIANVRRDIFLPRALAPLHVEAAEIEDGLLRIRFSGEDSERSAARGAVMSGGRGRR